MRARIAIALAVLLAAACRRGPDLSRGGIELVYLPQLPAEVQGSQRAHALRESRDIVAHRLQVMRIPAVVTSDAGRIRVALPAATPPPAIWAAKWFVPVGARLEFREVDEEGLLDLAKSELLRANVSPMVKLAQQPSPGGPPAPDGVLEAPSREAGLEAIRTLSPGVPAGKVLALETPEGDGAPWRIRLLGPVSLDNEGIAEAFAAMDQGRPVVALQLRREASDRFEQFSRRVVGRRLAVTLDGAILTAPYVTAPMPGGRVQISLGSATIARTKEIAGYLALGPPLPFPLVLEAERTIPPSRR